MGSRLLYVNVSGTQQYMIFLCFIIPDTDRQVDIWSERKMKIMRVVPCRRKLYDLFWMRFRAGR